VNDSVVLFKNKEASHDELQPAKECVTEVLGNMRYYGDNLIIKTHDSRLVVSDRVWQWCEQA
jgi:hypothetical protein